MHSKANEYYGAVIPIIFSLFSFPLSPTFRGFYPFENGAILKYSGLRHGRISEWGKTLLLYGSKSILVSRVSFFFPAC